MNDYKIPYEDLREKLARAESTLNALRRGEVDIVVGSTEPLVVRFKPLVDENERMVREWQTTFDAINSTIWILDHEQRILRSNKTAERIFQQPRKDFIGKHCWEVVHGTREAIPECPLLRVKQSLRRESVELPLGESWFEVLVDPILDEKGRYAGAVHIVNDITERKKMEEALRKSEQKLRVHNEISNVFLKGSHEDMYSEVLKKISEVTESRFGIFGYIDENENWVCPSLTSDVWDQCQISDKDVIFPKEKWAGIWGRAMLEKKTLWSNEPLKVPEGHVSITCAMAVPVLYAGQLIGNIALANKETPYHEADVALVEAIANHIAPILSLRLQREKEQREKEKMQEQLMQAQKMESIGTLAGGVAHDFNNILTTIIGNASLALMDVIKDESLRKEIEEIKIAGERAAALTRQLLAFSRKQIIQPEILNFNELLAGIEKMLGRLIGEDVEILMIPGPELWQVEADPGQMEQVIMNLAVNARDAMPSGGKLTIKTANTNLDEIYFREHGVDAQPGPYVMLAVSDTGSGMDKEAQEHIFEPFYTTKEKGKGTGLGLSTVYGIVKQNNGFIWVYSEPGQGTIFKTYLPKAVEDAVLDEIEITTTADLSGSDTVLIVEDDDSLRKLAHKALQQKGYKVLEAENGEDALRVSEEHEDPIDLLITDVVMPKMDGKETAERLQPLYPQMKVIYMSGYTDNAIVHHGVLAPGLNFIEKPFSPEGLARKVREVLDRGIE